MFDSAFSTVGSVVRGLTGLLMSLIGLGLLIEVVFGAGALGIPGVVGGIGNVVAQFNGINGLITLIVLAALLNR